MKRKRSYSATDVEQMDVAALLQLITVGCIVAIDVAKTKFVAATATAAGEVLKRVKFEHPRQTVAFLKWVDPRPPIARTLAIYHGHLEAMLARHWPEFQSHVDVYAKSRS